MQNHRLLHLRNGPEGETCAQSGRSQPGGGFTALSYQALAVEARIFRAFAVRNGPAQSRAETPDGDAVVVAWVDRLRRWRHSTNTTAR
jgi:hypothetical protein